MLLLLYMLLLLLMLLLKLFKITYKFSSFSSLPTLSGIEVMLLLPRLLLKNYRNLIYSIESRYINYTSLFIYLFI